MTTATDIEKEMSGCRDAERVIERLQKNIRRLSDEQMQGLLSYAEYTVKVSDAAALATVELEDLGFRHGESEEEVARAL